MSYKQMKFFTLLFFISFSFNAFSFEGNIWDEIDEVETQTGQQSEMLSLLNMSLLTETLTCTFFYNDQENITQEALDIICSGGVLDDTYPNYTMSDVTVPSYDINGATVSAEFDTKTYWYPGNPLSGYEWFVDGGAIVSGQGTPEITVTWGAQGVGSVAIMETFEGFCPGEIVVEDVVITPDNGSVSGCTDPSACNFNPSASVSDGSCTYVLSYAIGGDEMPPYSSDLVYTYNYTPGSTYEWTIMNGVILWGQGTHQVLVNWNSPGNGSLAVVETNQQGCSGTQVNVNVDIQNVISVEDEELESLLVYPNPANESLTIELNSNNPKGLIQLWDMSGRLVLNSRIVEKTTLELEELSQGIYLLTVQTETGQLVERIIIE